MFLRKEQGVLNCKMRVFCHFCETKILIYKTLPLFKCGGDIYYQLPTLFIQCSVLHIYIIKDTFVELIKMNISMSQDLFLLNTQYILQP
jgi:hypothetical protein